MGSSGLFGCTPAIACFVQVRLSWGSLGSFGFVWFVGVRPALGCFGFVSIVRVRHVGRWVVFYSFGTSGCVLVVAGYVWVRLFRLGAP